MPMFCRYIFTSGFLAAVLVAVALACSSDDDCVENAVCVAGMDAAGPGACVCKRGFVGTVRGRCITLDEARSTTEEPARDVPPANPDDYPWQIQQTYVDSDNDLFRSAIECPGAQLGDHCYNDGKCFRGQDGLGYQVWCLCDQNYYGLNCQSRKAYGTTAAGNTGMGSLSVQSDSRFVNPTRDVSTTARHEVSSIEECHSMCKLAGDRCHAFNFGSVGGTGICELLAPRVTEASPLLPKWIMPASGWSFACCVN